ncbi:hypothetical protein HAX54_009592, partial [Datura stramonium]|nr:hypothetical protein [Datura stramonium]
EPGPVRVFLAMNDYCFRIISLMANAIIECSVVVYDYYISPKDASLVQLQYVDRKSSELQLTLDTYKMSPTNHFVKTYELWEDGKSGGAGFGKKPGAISDAADGSSPRVNRWASSAMKTFNKERLRPVVMGQWRNGSSFAAPFFKKKDADNTCGIPRDKTLENGLGSVE